MADSIMAGATTLASPPRATPAPRRSLGLGVTSLHIDGNATAMQLADDCHCLLTAGVDVLEAMTETAAGPESPHEVREPWHAMLYTMRGALAALEALYEATAKADRQVRAKSTSQVAA